MNVLESVSQYKDRISVELNNTLTETELGSAKKKTGKVRDQYDLGGALALITTDRQSAFDRVLASIPFKGQVLNLASAWWFEETKHIMYNMIPTYEKFHDVKFDRDIVEDIVNLSSRYITDKSQPSCSLDLLDECGSYIKNQTGNTSEQLVQLQQKIDSLNKQKQEAVENHDFELGLKLKRRVTTYSNKLKKELTKSKQEELNKVLGGGTFKQLEVI